MWLTVGVFILSLISFFMATFILVRNNQFGVNRSFALFSYLVAVWMPANYIGANFKDHAYAKYFIQTDFLIGTFAIYAFWLLTREFYLVARPERRKIQNYLAIVLLFFTVVGSLGTLSPLLVTIQTVNSHVQVKYGPFYDLFSVVSLLSLGLACYNLIAASKRSAGRLKAQMKLMLLGLALLAIFVGFANFILPLFTHSSSLNLLAGNVSYLGIVVFVFSAFYAIIKHRLFDMRLAIVRTVGFLATIFITAAIYSLLVIGVGVPLITEGKITLIKNNLQLLLLVPPTIFIALTFHWLQRHIAQLTRRIFYQDAYDSRETLDSLSDTLISNNDIDEIMHRSLDVISASIKPSHAYFIVLSDSGELYRELALRRGELSNVNLLLEEVKKLRKQIFVKDETAASRWPDQFEHEDISLVLRLGSANRQVGVLFFGLKQNGRIYTEQDIDLLTTSAKNLAVALENAKKYEQISQFADTLREEVLKATASLRKANQKLKTLDALKDDFISMVSHQLRTPASSVHEAIQMLSQETLSTAERKHLTELAEASSEHLVSVVVDMLSIARVQAGHFDIDKTSLDMRELVERSLTEMTVLAEQKNIKLVFHKPKENANIMADRAKINEAISNYIENAIKYSEENSIVSINLGREGKHVSFEVTDSGIGVPEAERKYLFTKFYRTKNARKEHPDGNGIGLFVVKMIAEAHGGDVYYKPLPAGSLFGFWVLAAS